MGAAATENSSSPGLRGYLLRAASGLYMPRPRPREAVSPGRLVQVNWTASTGADPKFEIRVTSHLAGADFGYGVPKGPFERPETGLGGRGHFRGETRSRSCPSGA